jgi:hypothetical protein
VDLIARTHCSAEYIKTEDILVLYFLYDIVHHPSSGSHAPTASVKAGIVILCCVEMPQHGCEMSYLRPYRQAIMEKFEFFPIKCRAQRAAEVYESFNADHSENSKEAKNAGSTAVSKPMKMKARSVWCSPA